MLSMDEEYQEKRLQKKYKQATNLVTGVGTGFLELGSGIFDGIKGIVTNLLREPSKKEDLSRESVLAYWVW